jgi:hypothetical protein
VSTKPLRKRGEQNFRRLPDDVAAQLLRALECIPAPQERLALQRADQPRPPGFDQQNDYNVMWKGRQIGRVWRHAYDNHPWSGKGPWHWYWRNVPGRIDASGHGPTLESVMADFRRAWDARSGPP